MSRTNFGSKPFSYPQPVLIIASYDEDGTPDAMNAAWGGLSEVDEIAMCLSPGHKTVKNVLNKKAFTVSMADADHVNQCDYFGMASGNTVKDKLAVARMTVTKSSLVDAPIINELAVCLECRLISYDRNTCIMKGKIVNVSVDDSCMTGGRVDITKVRPISLDPFNSTYHIIGDKVGDVCSSGRVYMKK